MSHESARDGSTGNAENRSRRLVNGLVTPCKRLVNVPGATMHRPSPRQRRSPRDELTLASDPQASAQRSGSGAAGAHHASGPAGACIRKLVLTPHTVRVANTVTVRC